MLDALGIGKISVGPPYFNSVFVPLMAPLIFMMGVGPMARWKDAQVPDLAKRLKWAVGVAVMAATLPAWIEGQTRWFAGLGLLLSFWIVASLVTDVWERIRPDGGLRNSYWRRWGQIPRALKGMMVAHLGVAAFIFGVTMVKSYEVERDVTLKAGESTDVSGWNFRFMGTTQVPGPNYIATQGLIELSRNGKRVSELKPEKRVYRVQQMPMTEAAIRSRPTGDIYVALGQPVEGQDGAEAWVVRVYYKPFIAWIWAGCVLMGLGGLLAMTDRRYRSARREQDARAGRSAAPA